MRGHLFCAALAALVSFGCAAAQEQDVDFPPTGTFVRLSAALGGLEGGRVKRDGGDTSTDRIYTYKDGPAFSFDAGFVFTNGFRVGYLYSAAAIEGEYRTEAESADALRERGLFPEQQVGLTIIAASIGYELRAGSAAFYMDGGLAQIEATADFGVLGALSPMLKLGAEYRSNYGFAVGIEARGFAADKLEFGAASLDLPPAGVGFTLGYYFSLCHFCTTNGFSFPPLACRLCFMLI